MLKGKEGRQRKTFIDVLTLKVKGNEDGRLKDVIFWVQNAVSVELWVMRASLSYKELLARPNRVIKYKDNQE